MKQKIENKKKYFLKNKKTKKDLLSTILKADLVLDRFNTDPAHITLEKSIFLVTNRAKLSKLNCLD